MGEGDKMIDLEKQKLHFKNHKATFTDYGNIKILDFKNPDSNEYRIRFMFEEDYYRLHISGDLGHPVASNYCNMCFAKFSSDFVNNTGYFEEKIDCHDRALYFYDEAKAGIEIADYFDEYDILTDDAEERESVINEIAFNIDFYKGLEHEGYTILEEHFDEPEVVNSIGKHLGEKSSGILELYMLAFKLAMEQLKGDNSDV